MPVVSVTRLRVRSRIYLPSFFLAAVRSARQAARADGSLAVQVLRDRRNAFWTLTLWDSEASVRAFMLAAPHGPIMRKLLDWCDEAALAHFQHSGVQPPNWQQAHASLQSQGRRSKVRKPSAGHEAFQWDEPAVERNRILTFK